MSAARETAPTGFSGPSWVLALFGTAVGAGILYLPLQAGVGSIWALLLLALLMLPLVYLSHRAFLSVLMEGDGRMDYAAVVGRALGHGADWVIVSLYLLTFLAVLSSYAIGLNDNLGDYLHGQGWTSADWARGPYLSAGILGAFAVLYLTGQAALLRLMSAVSALLIVALLGLSLYLVPFWDLSRFTAPVTVAGLLDDMLLVLPILSFSFLFFAAMPAMVMACRAVATDWPSGAEARLRRIVLLTSVVLLAFVLLFVVSSVLALSPAEFQRGIDANLNGLTLLSQKQGVSPVLAQIGTLLGLGALFTSFAGVFLAVRESARALIGRLAGRSAGQAPPAWTEGLLLAAVLGVCWLITIFNPPIVGAFGVLISPLVGIFIFILPALVLARLRGWRTLLRPDLLFVLVVGVLILFSYDLGTWLRGTG